jgi:hypothetical protein
MGFSRGIPFAPGVSWKDLQDVGAILPPQKTPELGGLLNVCAVSNGKTPGSTAGWRLGRSVVWSKIVRF